MPRYSRQAFSGWVPPHRRRGSRRDGGWWPLLIQPCSVVSRLTETGAHPYFLFSGLGFLLSDDLAYHNAIRIIQILCFRPIEATMAQTTAVEFQRKFGEFQHKALREPVEITRHGRRELVLLSADHYDWLVAAARRTHRTADAVEVVIEAVERAEMDPEHAHLDELME